MGATKEQAEQTRQDLLNAALKLFSNQGFNVTRLEDISKEAGVTRGAFYWHFKNKTEVFCELNRQIMNDLVQTMKSAIDESGSNLQNLKSVLLKTLTTLLKDENSQQCGKLFYSVEHSPNVIAEMNKIKEEMGYPVRSLFSDLINEGKKANEIREELKTESVFLASISILLGTIDQILDDYFPITETDINTIVNIFIEGIKKINYDV